MKVMDLEVAELSASEKGVVHTLGSGNNDHELLRSFFVNADIAKRIVDKSVEHVQNGETLDPLCKDLVAAANAVTGLHFIAKLGYFMEAAEGEEYSRKVTREDVADPEDEFHYRAERRVSASHLVNHVAAIDMQFGRAA